MGGMIDYEKDAPAEPPTVPPAPPTGKTPTDSTGDASGMLDQIEKTIETKLPPDLKKDYLAIVVAGRQMMFSEKTHPMMEEYLGKIQGPQDVPKIVGHGIVKLIAVLLKESRGQLSGQASMPASITLMTYALKYVDGQLNIPIDKAIVDQTTLAVSNGMFAFWGIDKATLQRELQKGQPTTAASSEAPASAAMEEEV